MATPYRNELDALNARHAALSEELAAVQKRTREIEGLQQTEADLQRELAAVRAQLAAAATRRALPLLDNVRVASPCTAAWDEMVGDERVRFCAHCQKDVYNLSSLPRDEAEAFLREQTAEVCVRLYRRADGTVLTADCAVGVRRKRRRNLALAAVTALGGGAAALAFAQQGKPAREPEALMGTMVATAAPTVDTATPVMGTAAPVTPPPPTPHEVMMGRMPRHAPSVAPSAKPKAPPIPLGAKPPRAR